MKLDLINENFPIWEVTSWDFPDINFDNLYLNKFDQSSKTYESSELRQYVHENGWGSATGLCCQERYIGQLHKNFGRLVCS